MIYAVHDEGQCETERRLVTRKNVSVIFPAYNEEANIADTIAQTVPALVEIADQWEIIVVDDGSSDGTARIIREFADRSPNIIGIHHPSNRGYGAALKSGIMQAKQELIFFCDSDLQFDIRELERLMQWIDTYDIVIGFREKRRDPLYRKINAFSWNMLVRYLLGLKVRDIDCAFKIFHRRVFEKIEIRAVGAMVNTEILAQAVRYGFSIKEIPVSHYPRLKGKQTGANLRVIVRAFKELMRLYRELKISK